MPSPLLRRVRYPLAALVLCACHFDIDDISIQEPMGLAAGEEHDGPEPDAGAGEDAGKGATPVPEASGDGEQPARATPPASPPPTELDDDAGVEVRADGVGGDDDGDGDDEDAGVALPDPCEDGTFECAPVSGTVSSDIGPQPGAVVRFDLGGHEFSAMTDVDGAYRVRLPAGRAMRARVTAPGYLVTEVALEVPVAGGAGRDMRVYTDAFIQASLAPLGLVQDWDHGFVIAPIFPRLSGAGMTLDAASDPSWTWSSEGVQTYSDRLLPNGIALLSWSNVTPQTLVPQPFGPAGTECELLIPGVVRSAAAGMVTEINVQCRAVQQ